MEKRSQVETYYYSSANPGLDNNASNIALHDIVMDLVNGQDKFRLSLESKYTRSNMTSLDLL